MDVDQAAVDAANERAHLTGEWRLVLGDQEIVLKRTYGALRALNRAPGGFSDDYNPNASTVVRRLLNRDVETMALIIRVGLGLAPNALPKLEEQIFDAGVDDVVPQLTPYIFLLRTKPGTPIPGTKAFEESKAEDQEAASSADDPQTR